MHLSCTYTDIPDRLRGAVVVVGNFDGVHRGHRIVIDEARAVARASNAPLAVLSFEPHPRSLFRPDDPPFRLTPFAVRAREIAALGVDLHVVLTFDRAFSEHSAEWFVSEVLSAGLGASHVAIGYDFCFGHRRQGNAETLVEFGRRYGFGVTIVTQASDESGGAYSSSRVRQFLRDGSPGEAASILGRPFEIEGEVCRGDQRGRDLGYPTANIAMDDYIRPAFGIYAVRCGIVDAPGGPEAPDPRWHYGVANLGIRPMFETPEPVLEAHLFDFAGDLYGRTLRVQLIEFLRGEQRFDDVGGLVAQMNEDAAAARRILAGG
ncbi:bifunctional riboflavin kinase/FAD synthetase [Fodinicurvata sp. EGI_FJ10296]|uniref:bifunctional riboflavin kinase/FAD synthetase n=1 Tax=Fodinicurvata sp. EGI_FJ10296 TaxID=3231908 RepID=UPI0034551209